MARWDFPGTDPVDVQVNVSSGHIALTAAATDGLVVTAEPERGSDENLADDLRVSFADGRLEVSQERQFHWRRHHGLDVTIAVPSGSSCTAHTADADIICEGELDSLNARTASGAVTAALVTGPASAATASGAVRLGTVRDDVNVNTASGAIALDAAVGDIRCNTASGSIDIGTAAGSVDAKTASGRVSVASAVTGKISLASVSGDLEVGVVPGVSLYLDLSAVSGRISNELADADDSRAADLRLTCRTVSGNVRIRRASDAG